MAEVVVRGARFHFQRFGVRSQPVVFLHGLVMDNLSSFFFTLAPPVARFADVILYDLRGHGKSERTDTGYALSDMTDDLLALLHELGVESPVLLVGHSFGGLLAQAFAVAHPHHVAGLVLLDPLSPDVGWGERMARTLGLEGEERDRQIAVSFRNWLGRHSARKRTRLARTAEALVRGTSLLSDIRASDHVVDAELATIRCPALLLYGERSDARPRGERLASTLPSCELRIFPGCTHSVLWEATHEACRQVAEWLRNQVSDANGSDGGERAGVR